MVPSGVSASATSPLFGAVTEYSTYQLLIVFLEIHSRIIFLMTQKKKKKKRENYLMQNYNNKKKMVIHFNIMEIINIYIDLLFPKTHTDRRGSQTRISQIWK